MVKRFAEYFNHHNKYNGNHNGKLKSYDGRKIIGGSTARIEDYPFFVLVIVPVKEGFWTCGGTHIASHWVLTAGHCLYDNFTGKGYEIPETVELYWQVHNYQDAINSREDRRNKRIVRQQRFINILSTYLLSRTTETDIAMIYVPHKPQNEIYALLPNRKKDIDYYVPQSRYFYIVGFGRYKMVQLGPEDRVSPDRIRFLMTKIHRHGFCLSYYRNFNSEKNFCYGRDEFERTSHGDSGSPCFVIRKDKKPVIIGVVQGESNFYRPVYNQLGISYGPNYAVSVRAYLGWINTTLSKIF